MNENHDIIKTLDSIINHAEDLGMYIEYIALGSDIMKTLSAQLSSTIDPESEYDLLISTISKYRGTSIRETAVEGIVVKYLFDQTSWSQLG